MGTSHSLQDKYTALSGHVFMSGTQALVRLPMVQMRRDKQAGLDTATFITGYRGSPMGSYDMQLQLAESHLEQHGIRFEPGVNEDLAATAIWGTQQVPLYEDANKQGVAGIWYGKGPGVDRSGDVFRHANAAGSSQYGGVLCIAGDDHSAKSSTVPHQSDHAFISARMPMLYPSSVHEFVELGLLGFALSRYSGCWVGMKVISDTVETSAVVDLGDEHKSFNMPDDFELPADGLHIRWPDAFHAQDERLHEVKHQAVLAFARANDVDQWRVRPTRKRFGIMASGKAFEDARQALDLLGLNAAECEAIGLHLYKVRMPWPLEPVGATAFAESLEEVLVLEERREIIEQQLKSILYHQQGHTRTRVVGKFDEHGNALLPTAATLSVAVCARAIADRLLLMDLPDTSLGNIRDKLANLNNALQRQLLYSPPIERKPWFCSGCPHNTSTRVPEGSKALAGIGCHFMVLWMDRDTETFTHMGAEGVPWTAISHYVEDSHRFVNIGDGTYYHSGLLAIRAAVASGANMTYKVLYNDAVAMTGGQSIDGSLTPAKITHQLKAEGVWPVYLVSDEPENHPAGSLAEGVVVRHREELDAVMRELREGSGCNAIVYVQTCAAEKRRRRRKGLLDDPDTRLFINSDVCEGCGDCSTQSNCVSVEPFETAFGRKRRINQSSCNKDYSCINGFCPSFITVTGGSLKKKTALSSDGMQVIPMPDVPGMRTDSWNVLITGIGGTGVLTVGSILGMAAHIDGHAAIILDMAGLAQKGGAVVSHVRLASAPEHVTSAHISPAGADLLFAADAVVATAKQSTELLNNRRTMAVVNTSTAPVADFVLHRDLDFGNESVGAVLKKQVRGDEHFQAFATIAEELTGNTIMTNMLMLGYAWQRSLLPLSLEALQQAIEINGVAVNQNLAAFEWGRQLAHNAGFIESKLASENDVVDETKGHVDSAEQVLQQIIQHRSKHLSKYQNKKLANKYEEAIEVLSSKVQSLGLDNELLEVVAHNYARVLSYKDEYEVARLFSLPSFKQQLENQFEGDYKIALNLAPPVLAGRTVNGRPKKRQIGSWVIRVLSVLQHGRVLRGSALDLFGYTKERRAERQWIKWYEKDLQRISSELSTENAHIAQALLSLPDELRGFGPVKTEAMRNAELKRASLWHDFDAPVPVDLTSVA